MIKVEITFGEGDKKAGTLTDDLIESETTAKVRGGQEMANYQFVVKSRSIELPHDNSLVPGSSRNFAFNRIGIKGSHWITSVSHAFTPTQARTQVEMEQYECMEQLTGYET